jgi:L-fuconolactonase
VRVVDAHLHVWDLARSEYGWLTPDLGPLYATFTPEQAHAELEAAGIASAVLVQAEDSDRDTEYMLEAARRHAWIAGVVGWVPLDDPDAAERRLDRLQDEPRLRGVRHLVHDDPRDDFLDLPSVRRSLRLLAERDVPFDVPDAWPRHLAATADLAAALDGLRVVVDHLGKPPFGGPDWERWRNTISDVAARPNTVAKVSGLQVPGRPFTAAEVRPAWEVALELFGPERLMWGSDWPLTVLVGGYGHAWGVMSSLVAELSADEQEQILSGTAMSVYRLDQDGARR